MKKLFIAAILVQFLVFVKSAAAAGCVQRPDWRSECDLSEGFVTMVMKCRNDGKCLADIKKAISSGIDINGRNDCGGGPVMPYGHMILDFCGSHGPTALFVAQTPAVREVLIKAGADVHAVDGTGYTALFFAKDGDAVKALVKAGAEVDAKDMVGRTALFYKKSPDTIKALIDSGANVNAIDHYKMTPLLSLVAFGSSEKHQYTESHVLMYPYTNVQAIQKINILLAAKADVNARDQDGKTALDYARERKLSPAIIDALIRKGAK